MKVETSSDNSLKEEKGLARFERVRLLGKGAVGIVWLVKNKKTGDEVALKQMNLQFLNEKDKKSAESEVELMKVISGPTII